MIRLGCESSFLKMKHVRRTLTDYRIVGKSMHKVKKIKHDHELSEQEIEAQNLELLSGKTHTNEQIKALTTGKRQEIDESHLIASNENFKEFAKTIQPEDKKRKQLWRTSKPPSLPPSRYPEENKYMPKLLATQNIEWFGAKGFDALPYKNFTKEERLKMFERRRKELPDGYSFSGKQLRVVYDPTTGGLKTTWIEPHGPTKELIKRTAGRIVRQFSHPDRIDNFFHQRRWREADLLAFLNNSATFLQYQGRIGEKEFIKKDAETGLRKWDRIKARVGVDHACRDFICDLGGAFRSKVVNLDISENDDAWDNNPNGIVRVLKKHLTRSQVIDEIKGTRDIDISNNMNMLMSWSPTNMMGEPDMLNNSWSRDHLHIEGVDLRYTLINSDGLERMAGLQNLRYLNLQGCRYFDDFGMTKLHNFSESLEYLDLSQTRVTVRGFNFVHLLKNLRWINLSNMIDIEDSDMEDIVPLLRAVLPPKCTIITTFKKEPNVPLISSGDYEELTPNYKFKFLNFEKDKQSSEIQLYEPPDGDFQEDVEKMWNINPLGHVDERSRRNKLVAKNDWFDRYTTTHDVHYVNMANVERPLY